MQKYLNNWQSTLLAGVSAAATSAQIPAGDAAKLSLSGADYYVMTLASKTAQGGEDVGPREIVHVTAVSGQTLTLLRGQEGTAAAAWSTGTNIEMRVTAAALARHEQATGGGATNLSVTRTATTVTVGSSTGDDAQLPAASAIEAGVMTAADQAKLAGIAAGATANATNAQLRDRATHTGEQSMSSVTGLQTALDGKQATEAGKGLSSNDYTTAEKNKLAGLEASKWKGLHASLSALQTAHPTAAAGDFADVDTGAGADVVRYLWDVSDAKWVAQQGTGGNMTPAQIKSAYESNPDTNAYTDSEKTKLASVATGATANSTDAQLRARFTHTGLQAISTVSGLEAALAAKQPTETGKGLSSNDYTSAEKTKLASVATGATANADTDSLNEGASNLYHTAARVRATVLTGLSTATNAAITAADSVLTALGKLQAQLTGKEATLTAGANITIDRSNPAAPVISSTGGGSGSANWGGIGGNLPDQADLKAALDGKQSIEAGKGLSSNDYTTAEKNKLAGLEASKWKGLHASLSALQTAHPTAAAGDFADVDTGAGADVVRYLWDVSDTKWVAQQGSGGNMTPAQIKSAYESNPDTNAYTDSEKAKLAAIAAGAEVNHAAVSQAEAEAGTSTSLRSWSPLRVWQAIGAWWAASAMKTKLDGIAAGATANQSDAHLLSRTNHTGTQAMSTVDGLAAALASKETGLTAGANIVIDRSNPAAPVISSTGGGSGGGGAADIYRRGNILGTVSQSAGVPTGAIIERGSNANGEYVRYADGTQICTKKVTFNGLSLIPNGSALVLNTGMAANFVGDVSYSASGRMFDSADFECYGYFVTYGGTFFFANTGHRPNDGHPQWTSVGVHTATKGRYTVTAIGRWY